MRYRIDLSYDGAPFCGWQIQPGSPSVQETLEKALGTLLRRPVGVVGAGRTDTGVHALRYVAHFDLDCQVPDCAQLRYKLNAILPSSISVQGIAPVSEDFHARFSAVRRSYSYFLHRVKDPFMEGRSYLYAYPNVDFEAMNLAARALLGTHDFSCFEKTGGDNKTSVCTVYSAEWVEYKTGYWRFNITADRFLRNMVRAIVGTLLEVGRSKRTVKDFEGLVLPVCEMPDQVGHDGPSLRPNAGESAPGHALYLTEVLYPGE